MSDSAWIGNFGKPCHCRLRQKLIQIDNVKLPLNRNVDFAETNRIIYMILYTFSILYLHYFINVFNGPTYRECIKRYLTYRHKAFLMCVL